MVQVYTAAPGRLRRSVERYSGPKRAQERSLAATGSARQRCRSGASGPPACSGAQARYAAHPWLAGPHHLGDGRGKRIPVDGKERGISPPKG